MILIVDSGSTKTDWVVADGGKVSLRVETPGMNPVHMSEEELAEVVGNFVAQSSDRSDRLSQVFFYGAGCIAPFAEKVERVLAAHFAGSEIHVESDLLGAARAVCGHEPGIACILGTGSNSCYYDGERIVDNVPPLGYILGDEGSGTHLGRRFLNALFKGELPPSLRDRYLAESSLTYADVIRKVYREPLANRFLASCSLFIGKSLSDKELDENVREKLYGIVAACFEEFFQKNVSRYQSGLPVGAIGSIAHHYEPIFRAVAGRLGYQVGTVAKSPMDGLLRYHSC